MESAQVVTTVLGWEDIFKIVLASGVVAALIGWFKDWLLKSRDRARDARFSAIGMIAKLDFYAIQSRRNICDYEEDIACLDPQTDYMEWPTCEYPALEITDDAIRHFNSKHATDLAWLTTEKALASEHLRAVYGHEIDPTIVHSQQSHIVGYFGYEAYLLAFRLRDKYGLSPFGARWGAKDEFSDLLHYWVTIKAMVAIHNRKKNKTE